VGDSVLFLNGGMMSYPAWEPVAERLYRPPAEHAGHRVGVVRCDFRGQLLSPGEPHATLDGHAADVARLLDVLALPPVHVLATSFGAAVALLLAAGSPERVRSLLLVTATDRITRGMREGVESLRRVVSEVLAGADRDRFHEHVVREVYSLEYRRSHAVELDERRRGMDLLPLEWFESLDGILTAFARADLEGAVGSGPAAEGIHCPALVVSAARDRVIPAERSRALADALDADLVEHPTSGHALVAEEPEWLAEICLDFLER
jgi:pimeloyl-ACP methyl ester carboxylesterase